MNGSPDRILRNYSGFGHLRSGAYVLPYVATSASSVPAGSTVELYYGSNAVLDEYANNVQMTIEIRNNGTLETSAFDAPSIISLNGWSFSGWNGTGVGDIYGRWNRWYGFLSRAQAPMSTYADYARFSCVVSGSGGASQYDAVLYDGRHQDGKMYSASMSFTVSPA